MEKCGTQPREGQQLNVCREQVQLRSAEKGAQELIPVGCTSGLGWPELFESPPLHPVGEGGSLALGLWG